jgi:hypothetical protein
MDPASPWRYSFTANNVQRAGGSSAQSIVSAGSTGFAAWCLVPLAAWVAFAIVLKFEIWRLND